MVVRVCDEEIIARVDRYADWTTNFRRRRRATVAGITESACARICCDDGRVGRSSYSPDLVVGRVCNVEVTSRIKRQALDEIHSR